MDSLQPYLDYFITFQNLQGYHIIQQQSISSNQLSNQKLIMTPIKKQTNKQSQTKTSKVTLKLLKITPQDLSNGIIFTELFSRIQQMSNIQINHKPQTFMHNFSNFKSLYRAIQAFWKNSLDRQIQSQEIDFVQIAKNSKQQQLLKVCELFMKTAVLSKNYQYFIEKILHTKQETKNIFQKIVEQTIGSRSTDSPRKAKQKRLYDKLMELQNQNQKLQQVVTEICDQKLQIENKYKDFNDQILQKNKQITKLQNLLSQYSIQTPIKGRSSFGLQERNTQKLQKLKNKMVQLVKQHEKQMSSMRQRVQFFSSKMQRLNEVETTLQQYKDKIKDADSILNKFEDYQIKIRRNSSIIKQKDSQISDLRNKVQNYHKKIAQLQEKQIEQRLDLQRKTVQLEQSLKNNINTKQNDELTILPTFTTLTKTLSQQCPQIVHNHSQGLHQMNRILRNQLDRSNKTILSLQKDNQNYKKQFQKYKNLQRQNKRLAYIIKDLSMHRGQQNQILMGCLYEMRMKWGASLDTNNGNTMKQLNKNNLINYNDEKSQKYRKTLKNESK